MASELQEWKRRAMDAEKRCLRVARGLEDALAFRARPMLDTAVRVSIAELRAVESEPRELPTIEEMVGCIDFGTTDIKALIDGPSEADPSRGKTPAADPLPLNRFDCPECGHAVKACEDGTCASCGADVTIIADGKPLVTPVEKGGGDGTQNDH